MGRAGVTELQTEIARHEQEITALEAKLAQIKKEKASR